MKLHKLELYVIDHDELGAAECATLIEGPDTIGARVMATETTDIGPWSDEHPLNLKSAGVEEFRAHFFAPYEELHRAPEEMRELAYERAGGCAGEANYDPDLLATLISAADELERLHWLIENGKRHFGSSWREASPEAINAARMADNEHTLI